MHKSSLKEMAQFVANYLNEDKFYMILDIGSLRVKRQLKTYYDLITTYPGISCSYTGVDIVDGPNVDIVVEKESFLSCALDYKYNVIISGQTLEHVENPYMFMRSLISVADPDGCLICLIAPGAGQEHHPPDYWRILPAGMKTLFSWANIKPLEIYNNGIKPWCDTIGIGEYKI